MAQESTTTIAVTGRSERPKRTTVEAANTEFVIGEASPLDHLLGSLAACLNVIGYLVAKERGMVLRDLDAGTDVHVSVERV